MLSTAAAALAAIADAPAIAEPAEDQQLLALGAEFDRALAIYEPLDRRSRDLASRYFGMTEPLQIPVLLVSAADCDLFSRHFRPGTPDWTIMSKIEVGERYGNPEVQSLRRADFRVCTRFHAGATGIPLEWETDAHAQERAKEIVAAWERYRVAQARVWEELGCDAAEEAVEEADVVVTAIVERMVRIPARTMEGIRIKARALSFLHFEYTRERPTFRADDILDTSMTASIMHDLLAACPREQIPYSWVADAEVG